MTTPLACLAVLLAPSPAGNPDPDFRVTKVRVLAHAGREADIVGGKVVGSLTSATNDFEDIAEVTAAPKLDEWLQLAVPADRVRAYRFVKFQARNGAPAAVAEVEFFAGDRKLTGTPFGTTGDAAADPKRAFDGDPATAFCGPGTFGQYVGLDLGPGSQCAPPAASAASGTYPAPPAVTLTCATPGAVTRFTLDDGRPRPDSPAAVAPVTVAKSAVLQAVASKAGLADSPVAVFAYRVGAPPPAGPGRAEFHVGNSLTDTVDAWVAPLAASAGKKVRYYRFTIPGAPTDWLWDHPGSGFGESRYAEAFLARAPLTDLVTQPFAGHGRSVDNEAEYSGKFFDLARKHSPKVQHWLYVQWPDITPNDSWAKGRTEAGGKAVRFAPPAADWAGAVANHTAYTELVMRAMNAARAADIRSGACKPVKIIPGGPALVRLKAAIEAGQVPGLTDFNGAVFSTPTDFHMSKKGAYLIALVHYACIQGESPEGTVTAAGTGLTPEQAKRFQRIAWDTVTGYEHAGVKGGE